MLPIGGATASHLDAEGGMTEPGDAHLFSPIGAAWSGGAAQVCTLGIGQAMVGSGRP
jgi:hypothetical protein